jgi:phosphatidylserine/phosphatidylglycerophosphate/cardiolipin synthase-like enzyme
MRVTPCWNIYRIAASHHCRESVTLNLLSALQYESMQENQRGSSTTVTLLSGGVEVRVKASHDLMHFKSYVIDDTLLRTGSAN